MLPLDLLALLPLLAFPRVLGGTGPVAWLVLLGIVAVAGAIIVFCYRMLREE
jgi:hypothetical protein